MAEIQHVFGMYNGHEDIWKIFRLADNVFDDDLTGRINDETILYEGTKWPGFDSDLGFTRCIYGNNTMTSGAFRFVTDVDNSGNLHLKVNMYSDPDDPDETPALTYCDYNLGDKNDVLWFSMAWQMPYKDIKRVKVIYQRAQGEIVVKANDSTLLSVINNNFGHMHCVTGLDVEPDVNFAINEYNGAFQFSVGLPDKRFEGLYEHHDVSSFYPMSYKDPSTGVITGMTYASNFQSTGGRINPAIQNYCLYIQDKDVFKMGSSFYLFQDKNGTPYPSKYVGSDIVTDTQYDNMRMFPMSFTLKGSGNRFRTGSENYAEYVYLETYDEATSQWVILGRHNFNFGFISSVTSGSGAINGWLGVQQRADYDTTEGIYKKICGEDPYTIFTIADWSDFSAVYDGDTPVSVNFPSFVVNAYKFDSVGSTLWLVGHLETTDVDPEPPEEGKELEDEPIDPAENPTTSALDIGVIAIFNPTTQEMQDLTTEMQDVNILDEITKYFKNSPLEGIMSCHVVPVDVTTSGKEAPHFGNVTFETKMNKVTEQYYTKNFGSIHVDKKFASFLDFAPYTRSEIYLPYIGYRQLDTDDIMDKDVGVIYNFDILTGAILAQVTVNGSVHYQYSGNAVMQFPLTASNHNHLITSIVGLVVGGVGIAAGAAAGGPVGVAAAVGMGASMVGNAIGAAGNAKPEIQHGGSFAMTNGFMSVKSPHLVMNRPVVDIPSNFDDIQGRMSNKTKLVSECEGYTEYFKVDVDNISRATDKEKELIENILLGGFYA